MDEYNGWDYGPGNQDDGMASGWEYGPGDIQDQTSTSQGYWGDQWNNINTVPQANQFEQSPSSGWDFGPGNTENPEWFNYNNDPTFGLGSTPFQTLAPNSSMQAQSGTDWAGMLKGGTDFLGKLFTSGTGGYGGSGGSTNTFLKGLAGLMAAQQEKKSNQQMSQQIPQTVESVRKFAAPYDVASTGAGMMTPGATTMRDAAQQQAAMANQRLQSFRQNPNSDAGYKATNDQITNVLNRQAAMHGNRNNFNATAPAMLAAQAAAQLKYDQNYQQDVNNWDTRSGANISPVQAGGLEALMKGQQYGAQGNSPYYDALGKILNTNSYENNPAMQAIMEKINKALQ